MSDVYEIGVSLALDDGVSAGIEKARRDMAQLAGVLHTGGVSVQMLRETAQRALRVPSWGRPEMHPAPVRPEPPAEVPWAPADRPEAAPARTLDSDAATIAAPVVQSESPAWPPGPSQAVSGPPFAAPEAPVRSLEADGLVQRPDAPAMPAATILPPADRSAAPQAVPAMAELPAPVWMQPPLVNAATAPDAQITTPQGYKPAPRDEEELWRSAPVTAPILPPPILEHQAVSPVPSTMPVVAGSVVALPVPAMPASLPLPALAPVFRDAVAVPIPRPGYAPPSGASSPPEAQAAATWPGQLPMAPPATASSRPAPPMAAERSAQGPNEGDVFLDGQLVGRWMSRFLNREAGRASSGPTGFDARRGRLMPGPTVGG